MYESDDIIRYLFNEYGPGEAGVSAAGGLGRVAKGCLQQRVDNERDDQRARDSKHLAATGRGASSRLPSLDSTGVASVVITRHASVLPPARCPDPVHAARRLPHELDVRPGAAAQVRRACGSQSGPRTARCCCSSRRRLLGGHTVGASTASASPRTRTTSEHFEHPSRRACTGSGAATRRGRRACQSSRCACGRMRAARSPR